MPIIDYTCGKCGEKYDVLRGMTAEQDAIQCPKCEATEDQILTPSPTGRPIIH